MDIFEPLAFLAAITAFVTTRFWLQVYQAINDGGGLPGLVSRPLKLAASGSMITFALAGASVLALPVADLVAGMIS